MQTNMEDDTLAMLVDAAAAFAQPDGKRVRAARAGTPGFDRAIWSQMAEQGYLSVLLPESAGGLGLGMAAACAIANRLGYAAFPEPYVAAGVLPTAALAQCSAAPGSLIENLLSGERVVTLAWQNDAGDLAAERGGVTELRGSLDGICRFVRVAAADVFLIAARGADGVSLYALERDRAGLAIGLEPAADGGSSGRLTFSGVRVSAADRVAGPAEANAVVAYAADAAILATAAELNGIMERVLELTFDYLRTRKQFGKAIGSFQALQHRAVDIWMQTELTKAAHGAALARFTAPQSTPAERSLAAAGAKARAADAALKVCKEAVQLHGAIGFTDEYDLSLYFNRALVLCAWLGNAAAQRRRYAQLDAAMRADGGTP
ncbi:MAG: acyl-CoA dehydrogenase family protein [Burkholderiales bacterium]|nr:acyl-CoA dehydrogenase family protein [Burkholderiales bacterium]